jgi:hypothetical protein
MMRRVVLAALGLGIILMCGYGLLSGPLRDTDMSRFVHGDMTRSEAIALCVDSADSEIDGTDVPRVSGVRTTFEGRHGLEWTIAGTLVAGDMRGPFNCIISWTAGGATSYIEYLSLPNGEESGHQVPD